MSDTTNSEPITVTFKSGLDLSNWDSGPVRPMLKAMLYMETMNIIRTHGYKYIMI